MEKGGLPLPINASPEPAPALFPAGMSSGLYPPALTSLPSLGVRHVHGERI